MDVEIWAKAAQFPEKEYMNGIAVAMQNEPVYPKGLKQDSHCHMAAAKRKITCKS
jgi:hypothetical protein